MPAASRKLAWKWLLLSLVLPAAILADDTRADRPNVILCMADDLGWGDVGFHGHPVLKTPHLDAMAETSLVLDRFYAGAPVCSPTRGSCLTGRHPSRYGIEHANDGHLKREEVCLAEVLREAGYATGHFGKWHLGTLSPDFSGKGKKRAPEENYMTPGMAGFQEWFSTEYACATWDPYAPANAHGKSDPRALYWHNGKNIIDGAAEGLTGGDSRIIMDKALPFIEQAVKDEKAFFAVIWFHAPHQPVVAGPEYRALYPNESENKQHFYGAVTELDEQMGRLREKLRELQVAENTMLWFCADNGPEGNPGPQGRSQGTAGPFRGRKRSLYEGGVRVAGLLEWPARIRQARKTEVPAATSDYFPTILAAIGQDDSLRQDRPYDGISLLPLIDGAMTERPRPIAFQFGSQAALSDNRYKLVHNELTDRPKSDNGSAAIAEWELYDLVSDPSETRNLAGEHPELLQRMQSELEAWQRSCTASAAGRDY
jgi:arylsulfatase A-like enzyme